MSEIIRIVETSVIPMVHEYIRWIMIRQIVHDIMGFLAIAAIFIIFIVGLKAIMDS